MKIEDIDIGYKIFGQGSPILLIMGYASTKNLWEEKLIDWLTEEHQVIIVDNRGMGETTTGEKPFSIKQFAKDTYGLMEALEIEKADILGWSMGSYIAQEIALMYPEKVKRLVLYASTTDPEMFPPSSECSEILGDTSGSPEEQGARWISLLFSKEWLENNHKRIEEIFYRPMGTINLVNIGKQFIAINQWKGTTEQISKIKNKTLIIDGKDDSLVPVLNAEYLAQKIEHSKIVLVEKTGHGLMFQKPNEFCQIILDFLDGNV
jgi:pimeloyl-ACP methyl ester carboxylesterase